MQWVTGIQVLRWSRSYKPELSLNDAYSSLIPICKYDPERRLVEEGWPFPGTVVCSSLFYHPLPQSIKKRCVRYLWSSPLCYSTMTFSLQNCSPCQPNLTRYARWAQRKGGAGWMWLLAGPLPPWSVNNAGLSHFSLGDIVDSELKNVFYSSDFHPSICLCALHVVAWHWVIGEKSQG